MVEGITSSGFAFKLEDEVLDDYELLEALVDIDGGNASKVVLALRSLLGEEQYEAAKNHLKKTVGKTKTTDMVKILMEIIEAAKGKNS